MASSPEGIGRTVRRRHDGGEAEERDPSGIFRNVQAYSETLHDPEVTINLKDFEKPYFIARGAVAGPGKYEWTPGAAVRT
jgi:hypothetical protein